MNSRIGILAIWMVPTLHTYVMTRRKTSYSTNRKREGLGCDLCKTKEASP
jgi:hypothetical protein